MEPVEEEGPRRPDWLLPMLSVVAVVALIVAAVLFLTRDDSTDDTVASTVVPTEPATSRPTGTEPPSTAVSTTASATTAAPSTTTPEPSGSTITIDSVYLGQVTLWLAVTDGDVSVYDSATEDDHAEEGDDDDHGGVRCVMVVTDGIDDWTEWCGTAGEPIQFVTAAGDDVLVVELGAAPGDVSVSSVGANLLLTTNGCPISAGELLDVAGVAPAVMTGVICVPGEAFVGIGSVLLQDGPPDGGAVPLQFQADGSWTSSGGGTSFPCDDAIADGVDRCALYGVASDLFEALLPIPPAAAEPETTDIVGLRDATEEIRGVVDSTTDPDEIGTAVAAAYGDPVEGPAPAITRFDDVWFGQLDLVTVVVPALDDSIQSTTYSIWISRSRIPAVVKAFAFETCARGLSGDGLCV